MESRTLNLSKLLKGICDVPSVFDCRVHGLTLDSRQVRRGDAFVALQGRSVDGTQYIDDAIARGAVVIFKNAPAAENAGSVVERGTVVEVCLPGLASKLGVLASRYYGDPSEQLSVVGVTGTNGKSSVSHYLAQVLSFAGIKSGLVGTLGYGFIDELTPASHTTPDVLRVHSLLAGLLSRQAQAVVMEVSSHGLDQGRVDGIKIDGAIFTNLTRDHLDYHATMQAYGDAKRRLFERPELRFAVVNVDDEFGRSMLGSISPDVRLFTFGISHEASVCVIQVEYLADGMCAEVATPAGRVRFSCGLVGAFNLSNLLAVIAAAVAMDVDVGTLEKALGNIAPVAGRMQRFFVPRKPTIVVDYAHTPDALASVLGALRPHAQGNVWCVFGCGGDRDPGKRALMAAIAEQHADRIIVTDDNPRTEPPRQIVNHIMAGFQFPDRVVIEHDREKAISHAMHHAGKDDLILVAGKGHEDYQEIGVLRRPYSDIEVVGRLLGLGGNL